jgi:hypothetical protein
VNRNLSKGPLIGIAIFAFIWLVHRAFTQSLTLDEAISWTYWVNPIEPNHWEPNSNNHVLNSALMRVSVWIFGLSELSLRLPALLGGLLYLVSALRFSLLVCRERFVQVVAFLCFAFNPFIMDYLVAARGYGLALGFFMAAVMLMTKAILAEGGEIAPIRRTVTLSTCAGLAISSNFSFAYACCALVGVWLVFTWRRHRTELPALLVAAVAPVTVVLLVLAGHPLIRMPKDELFWGADRWSKVWADIRDASLNELNRHLVNPLLIQVLEAIRPFLLPLLMLCVIASVAVLWLRSRAQLRLPFALLAVFGLTMLAHWIQFKLLKIPLPFERTSIFFVPLITALVVAVLAIQPPAFRWVRTATLCTSALISLYFVGTLRNDYFREWRETAEVRAAFSYLVDFCRQHQVREVISNLNVTRSLNFYRQVQGVREVDEFAQHDPLPPDKPIYVLLVARDGQLMKDQNLEVVWHGNISDLVIAVRRDLLSR